MTVDPLLFLHLVLFLLCDVFSFVLENIHLISYFLISFLSVAIELIVEHISELLSNTAAFLNQKRLLISLAPVSDCVFWDTTPHRKKLQRLH